MGRLLIPYLLGIVWMDTAPVYAAYPMIPLFMVVSLCLLALSWVRGQRSYQQYYGLCLFSWLFLLGGIQFQEAVRAPEHMELISNTANTVATGLVLERMDRPGKGPRLLVEVSAVKWREEDPLAFRQKVMVYATDSIEVFPGDVILFRGTFTHIPPPDNPYAFNYAGYLKYQGVQVRHFARAIQVLPAQSVRSRHLRWVYRLRQRCREHLLKGISETGNQAVLLALVLGNKTELDEHLRSAFASAGAMHVLAVSGLHVGIIGLFAGLLFGWLPLGQYRKTVRTVSSLTCIWMFTMLTGAGASVQRAAVMFTVVLVGHLFGGRARIWNSLALAAFLLLWRQPLLLFQLGFQLSFLAVAGIVFFQPLLVKCWFPSHPILKYAWSLWCVGCGAQLTTMPLTIYHFGQFPLLFWLSGWIAIPLATLILGTSLLKLAFSSFPLLDACLGTVLEWFTTLLNESMVLLSSWTFGTLNGLVLSPLAVCLMYIALVVSMVAYRWQPAWRTWSAWPMLLAGLAVVHSQIRRDQQSDWYILLADDKPVIEMLRSDHVLRIRPETIDSTVLSYADRGMHQKLGIRSIHDFSMPYRKTFIIQRQDRCLGVVGGPFPSRKVWNSCSCWLLSTDGHFPEWLDERDKAGMNIIIAPDYDIARLGALGSWESIWSLSEKGGLKIPTNNAYE